MACKARGDATAWGPYLALSRWNLFTSQLLLRELTGRSGAAWRVHEAVPARAEASVGIGEARADVQLTTISAMKRNTESCGQPKGHKPTGLAGGRLSGGGRGWRAIGPPNHASAVAGAAVGRRRAVARRRVH